MSGLVNAEARPKEELYNLESLPGAWVRIRRFDHGERIDRLSKILIMSQPEGADEAEAKINHKAARIYDFAKAIVDHNLGDSKGVKYDFKKPESVMSIDAEIGDEIDDLIGQHQEVIPEAELPKSEESLTDTSSTQSKPMLEPAGQ